MITAWAVFGGIMVIAVVLMNVLSVLLAILGVPFGGDFELTQMGIAIAAFAFLPYCQLTGANVTADIFTANASPRTIAIFAVAASVVALMFGLLLLYAMYGGMVSQRQYNYTTAILQVPIWWAYVPGLLSLALLAIASFITLTENLGKLRRGRN
ncbi:TRAP transporter small permease [Pararhodobacter sp.]|uniref:TRAP transporter small permease n=1 Tax=Pararhodobacter sp. TaxID=2127056 RepID=UPI002AFE57ED|nr:TRAP transporter small permease subunit [Pararhodobacter sp.]